jgi:hypothetical protein
MAASKVMTLRIDPALLDELREVAREEGRSVSAQVVHLVRRDLEARGHVAAAPRASRRKPLPTYGWLRHLAGPDTFEEFRDFRRSLSKQIEKRLQRYPKVK